MRSSARRWPSALTPSQTLGKFPVSYSHATAFARCVLSPTPFVINDAIRAAARGAVKYCLILSARLVSTWNVCCGHNAITANTLSTNANGTSSWNRSLIQQTATTDTAACRIREEQEPGSSGKAVIAARKLALAGFDYDGKPATGEKSTRWRPFAIQAEAGNVQLVRGPWNEAFLDELTTVPAAAHDGADVAMS
jgi:predicted phage terminase large subunit-like protein